MLSPTEHKEVLFLFVDQKSVGNISKFSNSDLQSPLKQ